MSRPDFTDPHDVVFRVLQGETLDESEVVELARYADEQADQITSLRSRLMAAEMSVRLLVLKARADRAAHEAAGNGYARRAGQAVRP